MKRFLILGAILVGCSGCVPDNAMLAAAPPLPARVGNVEMRSLSEHEKSVVRQAVRTQVPNPDYAEFRWAKFPKAPAESEYYCAQINAQTAQGSFVGFRPYIAMIETRKDEVRGARLIELSADRLNVEDVLRRCREHGLDPFLALEGEGGLSQEAQRTRR